MSTIFVGQDVTIQELPYLCYMVVCIITINGLDDGRKNKLQELQQKQYKKVFIDEKQLAEERFQKLLNLAKLCLLFY